MYYIYLFRLNITGHNYAGDTEPIEIVVLKKDINSLDKGVVVSVNSLSSFSCGTYPKDFIYASKVNVWNELDGLENTNASLIWDEKMDGFFSDNNVTHFNFSIYGILNIEEEQNYRFVYNQDYATWKLTIDDSTIIDKTEFCNYWGEGYVSQKLTVGYHNFKMEGYFTNQGKFRYLLKCGNQTESSVIPFYAGNTVYNPVSGLTINRESYIFTTNNYVSFPFNLDKGKARNCISVPDLPKGLTFDVNGNYIVGKVLEEYKNQKYSITCESETSVTNTVEVSIAVTNNYINKITGYYMKSNDEIDCSKPFIIGNKNTITKYIINDDTINHEEPQQNHWDGLSTDFNNNFGVVWEGYLYIEKDDKYTFELTSIDGSWLMIDNDIIIDNGGNHDEKSLTNTIDLKIGYHPIVISYTKGDNKDKEIFLKWKTESSSYTDPSSNIYSLRVNSFDYKYMKSSYIKDIDIKTNSPILLNDESLSNCKSDIDLPNGLQLSDNCDIIGNPIEYQDEITYVISAKMNDNNVNTEIKISVIPIEEPNGLYFFDEINHVKNTTLELILGKYYEFTPHVSVGTSIFYKMSGFPDGFIFDEKSQVLYGIAKMNLRVLFIVNAYIDENQFITFTPEYTIINSCGEEKMHVIELKSQSSHSDMRISLYSNQSVVYSETLPKGLNMFSLGKCLIDGDFNFTIDDNSDNTNKYDFIFYNNGIITSELNVNSGEKGDIYHEITTSTLPPPLLYRNNTYIYYIQDKVEIIPIKKLLLINSCTIEPNILPEGLIFDNKKCSINGYVKSSLIKTEYFIIIFRYTITATNDFGSTIKVINITVNENTVDQACALQGNSLISITVSTTTYPKHMKFTLYTKDYTFIDFHNDPKWEEFHKYTYHYCLDNDLYILFAADTDKEGWNYGYIDISVNSVKVNRVHMLKDEQNKTVTFNGIFKFIYSKIY